MTWLQCLAVILLVSCQLRTIQGNNKRQTPTNGNLWEAKADIEFVLDASDTVGPAEREALRSMLQTLVSGWTIGPDNMQVGVVTYGGGAHNQFFLNEAANATELAQSLKAMTFSGGSADAADAIRYAYRTSFSQTHGARDGVPHIIVHVTDGPSASPAQLLQEAENAHNGGVTIFNVGVGTGVELDHLAKVASDPSSRYVLQADTFSSLVNLVPLLSSSITNEIPVTAQAMPQPSSCLTQADLVLLIDSSSSVGQTDYEHLEDFVKDLIVQLPVAHDQVQVGMVQFASSPRLEFPLNMYSDRLAMLKAIENLQFMGGGTDTADALLYVNSNVYNQDGGARTNVPRVTVVITDGQSVDSNKTLAAAEILRQDNIGVIAVGVGSDVNEKELENIANDPDSENVFKVTNYKDLQAMSTTILNAACALKSMITPQPTLPAGSGVTQDPCHDKLSNCYDYEESSCTSYESWARTNCLKRCGFCQTAEEVACENKVQNCETYGTDVCSAANRRQWAFTNCKRFCGYCDSTAPKLGFYGQCMYKGLEYAQSERWEDGCDYECVCEDAKEGQYRCYNRCPVYHDLPPECTLVGVPNECCLKPVCNFNQKLTTSEISKGASFNAQNVAVCEHEGQQYFQDQTWEVGCDLKCVCTNATLGAYRCQSYCPSYPALPTLCRLVQKPGQCCQEPVCEFNTQTGSFTGFGTLSGRGVDMKAPNAVCEDDVIDCEAYGRAVCTEQKTWAMVNCAKFCNLCTPDTLIPGPNDVCYYNGQKHQEGETWKVGCDMECSCEDGIYGYYRCYSSCPSYLNLPDGCQTTKTAGECCPTVVCQQGTFYPSSTNVFSLGNGGGLKIRDAQGQVVEAKPTLPSGSTLPPGTFGGSTGLSNIRLEGCLFNGRMYIQNQQWHDGCNHTCTCNDASTGQIACRQRCPTYLHVPASCGEQADPSDPCCSMPDCPASAQYVPVPVYGRSSQSIGAVVTPNLPDLVSGMFTARYSFVYSAFTVAPPTAPVGTLKPGGLDHCDYHGTHYTQGQSWEDGCDYNCVCEDASTGAWRCVEKCEKYVDIPKPYCHLEQDPINTCCQRPVCNFLVGHNQIEGHDTMPPTTTTTTTAAPATTKGYWEAKCVYKGTEYALGQSWYDGCSLKCKCDDASQNVYTCVSRCPAFPSDYDTCEQRPDPEDPTCCVVPFCTPDPYPTPFPGATQAPGRIPPRIPVIPPGIVTGGNTTGYCDYSGVHYSQSDSWEDGCDLTCVCDDAQTGHYKCTEKCQRFGQLPADCRLVADFAEPCCQVPRCTGEITDINGSSPLPGVSTPAPAKGCVYNSAVFKQGEVWQEGCLRNCRCEDAENGLYVCTDRCPSYGVLPPECTLVSDPADVCCLKPRCVTAPVAGSTVAPVPGLIPTLAPGKIIGSATYPTPTPGPNGETPGINYCIYKGVPYAKGETWQDGCDYGCVCVDPSSGRYECTERCTRYAAIPAGCVLVKDAADPCCQRPVCSPDLMMTPSPALTQAPQPGSTAVPPFGSTVSPPVGVVTAGPTPTPKDVCVYKNQVYTDGQTWYDGCDYSCTCENGKEGIYRCIERCAEYTNLPAECSLGPDPADPLCCQRPLCEFVPQPNKTTGYLIPPLRPGVLTGGSVTPTPLPYATPTPGPDGSTLEPPRSTPKPKEVCIYNGQEYSQGQRWADGCDYDCQCVDAPSGRYQCTEKCLKWSSIPAQCTLVPAPNQPCCTVPYCDTDKPTPQPQATLSPQPQTTRAPFIGPDGSTLAPPTRLVYTVAPPKNRCLYNGVPYATGATWEDGCDLKCVCEDGESNVYRCDQRCNTYQLPKDCVLVTDPDDSCCRVPSCAPVAPSTAVPTPGTTLAPVTGPDGSTLYPPTMGPTPGPTLAPVTGPDGSTLYPPTMAPTQGPNVSPKKPPYLVPTGVPGTQIGTINNPNTKPGSNQSMGCLFNGVTYNQGQRWDDGCTRKCVCLNSTAGVYECKERCNRYLNIPSNCQLVLDTVDPCCKTPLCKATSTLTPTAIPTAEPNITPVSGQTTVSPPTGNTGSPTPYVAVTEAPKKMCVYKGQYYLEGQQWYDGCEKLCVCDDGATNYFRCSDRCPSFGAVPPQCQLVASPDDPVCCQVPSCLPTPGPNGYPTAAPNAIPTPTVFTNPTGVITGIAPTPTPRPGYPTPQPRNACVYKGNEYKGGQRWQDGCDYDCVCVNETTGFYKCNERCSTYPMIPSQCQLIPDTMDFCCKKLECDFSKPTPDPFSPTPGSTRAPNPNLHTTFTPTPGTTDVPPTGVVPTPGYRPPTVAPQFTFCIYNGLAYRQGESWNEGCKQVCTCDDSTRNYYTCADRCPVYTNLPAHCTMKVNPADPCCQVPECYVVPTPGPGVTPNLRPGQTPNPIPTGVPGVIVGIPNNPNTGNSQNQTKCVKNGIAYNVGDTWQDGCQYNCECLDTSGRYKCTERCVPYPSVPDFCVMTTDPKDSCCKVPMCPDPFLSTPTPMPGVSTLAPTPTKKVEMCVYKGSSYTQGQRWEDGCDKVCVCENAQIDFHRCSDRCVTFPDTVSTCRMVADPKDPTCCKVPECQTPDNLNVTGNVGVITGNGKPPTPLPTLAPPMGSTLRPPTLAPGQIATPQPPSDVCVYNGRAYTQGQQWQDGCDFNCECVDAAQGTYKCTDRCARYPQNIAAFCTMVRDPADPCCMTPDCSATPSPLSTLNPPLANASTLAPPHYLTPFPQLHSTLVPGVQFCVYKGVPYSQGQTWNDGCDKTCRCEDVVTGQINCDDRCMNYAAVPAGCQLVTDPKDSCCQVPQCPQEPNTSNNSVVIKGPKGTITGSSLPPNTHGPLTRNNVCIYHGRTYQQDEVWDDGCSYTCQCIDSTQGKYLCKQRCERIVQLPPTCNMIADPADQCCQMPYCLPWPPRVPTAEPQATPTGYTGTLSPSATPTASPEVTPVPEACIYNNQVYRQDQVWYNGCNSVCRCEDASAGFYRCQERCVRYTPEAGCLMVPDPQDPTCCEIPRCPLVTPTPLPGVTPTPGIITMVTPVPGQIVGQGKVPTPTPTAAPTPGPDGSTITPTPMRGPDGSTIIPTPAPTTGCYYKGVTYKETQKWEDGCDYVCECVDGSTGRYTCSEKCPVLPQAPAGRCVKVQDPSEPCCMTLFCDFLNPTPFPNGTPTPFPILVPGTGPTGGVPTATPTPEPGLVPKGFCVYNGAYYRQGQQWSDGCAMECVCNDGTTGDYTCRERCKSYGQLAAGCTMKVNPDDSCCLVPDCPLPPVMVTSQPLPGVTGNVTPNPSYVYTGINKGSFTGGGNVGHPVGTFGSNTGFTNGCVYKQNMYAQDAEWDDGCDYHCVCVDALRGKYKCSDRCITYYFLPPVCRMEQDPTDICCKQARCYPDGFTSPTTPPTPTMQVSGQTATGPSGVRTTDMYGSTYTDHTGTGTVIDVTPNIGTGPSGVRTTDQYGSTYTDHTGTGTVIDVTPNIGTGPSGVRTTDQYGSTYTDHTGTGTVIDVTPNIGTGPSGVRTTDMYGSTQGSITGTRGACVYKGVIYHTKDNWDDGCDLHCICDDDVAGLYTCTYRCPAYSGLPKWCHLQTDASDPCCKKPVCSAQGTTLVPAIGGTPTRSPTLEPSVTNVIPLGTHTIISGTSRQPGTGMQTIYGGRSSCVYKGVEYIPGETWDDACDFSCTCIGENGGLYRCVSKCPSYPALPQYCTLSTIPGTCCASLSCQVPHVGAYNPYPQVEPQPKPTAGPDGLFPTPQPTVDPQLIVGAGLGNITGGTGLPGGGAKVPGGYLHNLGGITDKCIYDLAMWNQGEEWNVNCTYKCKCLDSRTGFYQCTQRCPTYDMTLLPATCHLVDSPVDNCCQTPSCPDSTGHQITNVTQIQQLYPIVGSFNGGSSGFRPGYIPKGTHGQFSGSRNGCVYKDSLHGAGSKWEDGCDFDCECVDGNTGLYQCRAKCVTYSMLPPMCKLVDVDGECCPKIECAAVTTTPLPSECRDKIDNCDFYHKTACSGAFEGWARDHCPLYCGFCTPDYTTTPLPCEDTVPCEQYGDDICTSVAYAGWSQAHCRKTCNLCGTTIPTTTVWTTPSSGCFDAISYCDEYGSQVCTDSSYKGWVLDNCQKYCGICDPVTGGSTTPEPCEDLLDTCALYGKGSCGGQFFGWARHNCRKFCDLCGVTAQTTDSVTHTTEPPCADKLDNCAQYSQQYCSGDYLAWAADNCPAHCNLCNYQLTTPTTVKTATDPGWLLLLKGVTGQPGDLWHLWSTTQTANENVPQAHQLTSQYPGNYKPQIANQWSVCQFEKVKVSILSNGVEKANIIFDVRGSNKNDWFKPEHVISSTFNDLPTKAGSFGMAQSATTGHEFAVGEFAADCQGTGWFLVSTNDKCPFQQASTGSRFYYSLTNTVAQLALGNLGEGDVFAIEGQGGNCMGTMNIMTTLDTFTGGNDGCFYNGHLYAEGETWQDGCLLNCTCQDHISGQYFCSDLCPTYKDLPQECSLEKKEGECCPELKCPYNTGDGCYYKNQTYPQGATWQDGCDYDCTCSNGSTGFYSCTDICQDWSSLPVTCHQEDPAPGMCCKRPVCPAGVTVDFTPR